ncbi:MAG: cupin domain-containing protein [Sandaracinaceae bacterium]|nr:cupin domain-containing protein [Sandaracinaceae bacterium]
MSDDVFTLEANPVHLGLGARVYVEEPFTGELAWYEAYGARRGDDGDEGRLVSMHTFDAPWTSWEMHPRGDELVVCLRGVITLHQERDGLRHTAVLRAGEAIVNPPGVWHTADVDGEATALFITAGAGTEHRPRA